MRRRNLLRAALLSISCLGLVVAMLTFGTSIATRASSRSAKCTVDIGNGNSSECTLVKANDEWILWSNTSSKPRSVHFKVADNPFMEKSCWDVDTGARARSGPIARGSVPKAYFSYSSDVPCASNPPSDSNRGASKIIVQ
jgi:hypothetical protein